MSRSVPRDARELVGLRHLLRAVVLLGALMVGTVASAAEPPTIIGVPLGPTTTPPTLTITGLDGTAIIDWTLTTNGSTIGSGSGPSPLTVGPLGGIDGTYLIEATQTVPGDPLGTSLPAAATFALDTTAPGAPTITPLPGDLTNVATQTLSWSGTDTGPYTWQLTGPSPVGPTSTPTPNTGAVTLLPGLHSLQVQQADAAGNVGPAATYAFTVDTVMPVGGALTHLPGSNATAGFTRSTNVTVTLTAAATDTIDGTTTSTQPITYALSAAVTPPDPNQFNGWTVGTNRTVNVTAVQGPTTIILWARDGAGNASAGVPLAPAVVYDSVAPAVAATSFPVPGDDATTDFGPLANLTIGFTEAVQDPHSVIRICIDPCGFAIATAVTVDAARTGAIVDPFPLAPTTPLATATRYEVQLPNVRDNAGNTLKGPGSTAAWTFMTSADGTPPGPVTALSVTPGVGRLTLTWTGPGDGDLARVTVLRSTSPPVSAADATATRFVLSPAATSLTDIGRTPGVTYHYAVFTEDAVGNPSPLTRASGVPTAPPVIASGLPPVVPPVLRPPATYRANLMTPKKGAVLRTLRPLLEWKRVKGATIYNIQIFDGSKKIVGAFARAPKYRVPPGRIRPGRRLTWKVWAAIGPKRRYVARPMISWFDSSLKAR